jgi:hypothetical protein
MDCGNGWTFKENSDFWQFWYGLRGPAGPAGPPGSSVELRGPVASTSLLPESASSSELWMVGASSPYVGYFWNGTAWIEAGYIMQGPQGEPGEDGEDGVSPEVTITAITGGHTVTITDAEHPAGQTFDVMDGEDGAPGTPGTPGTPGAAAGFGTPTATVDANVGTPSVEITASGPDTAKVFSFAFHNLKGEPGSGGGGPDPYTSDPADLAAAASPGSASQYSRGDHVHKLPTAAQIGAYVKPSGGIPASDLASGVIPTVPTAYTSNPKMDGSASPGSSMSWAKGEHIHPADTNKQDKITASGILKGDGNGGVSAAVAGTDYLTPATAYSPVVVRSSDYTLAASDAGNTIIFSGSQSGGVTITIDRTVLGSLPQGAEIAFVKDNDQSHFARLKIVNIGFGNETLGWTAANASGVYAVIPKRYGMITLKKIFNNDYAMMLFGNVEVVS